MRLSSNKVQCLLLTKGISISILLKAAGLARSTYYALLEKENLLPKSLRSIAGVLGVNASELLVDEESILAEHYKLIERVDEICAQDSELDREMVRHVLILLDEPPIERLRRALTRGQGNYSW